LQDRLTERDLNHEYQSSMTGEARQSMDGKVCQALIFLMVFFGRYAWGLEFEQMRCGRLGRDL
jgi:hypothetical protein